MYRHIFLLSILPCAPLSAISMVYNFRIAQITKQPVSLDADSATNNNHTLVALLFDQYRKKYTGITQNFAGALGSFIYDFKPYYFRADCAVSHIHEWCGVATTFSGTETDDILFTCGRNFILNNQTTVTLSGLFGIPTHRIFRLQHVDFGYSQVGTGIQLDGSYSLNDTSALLYGTRYIYFIPRDAYDDSCLQHDFTLGNVADILFAYKNNWNDTHGLESGYTFRTRFGADICPNLDDTITKTNYIRSNFYLVYKYRFSLDHTHNRFMLYGSYGFDHSPQLYGSRYIITLWTSWTLNF